MQSSQRRRTEPWKLDGGRPRRVLNKAPTVSELLFPASPTTFLGEQVVRRRNPPRASTGGAAKSPYNGAPTLETIPDPLDGDENNKDKLGQVNSTPSKPPPPAPSALIGPDGKPLAPRRRRSSSIKRKLSPGVVPTKAVDWEIPRKALHSSIGT